MNTMVQTVSTWSTISSSSSTGAAATPSPSAIGKAFQRSKYSSCSKSKSSSGKRTSEGTTKGPSWERISSRTTSRSRSRTFTDQHESSKLPCQRLSNSCDQKTSGSRTGRKRSWKAALKVSSCPKYMCPWQSLKAILTPKEVGTGLIGCSLSSSLFMQGKPPAWPSADALPPWAMKGMRIGWIGTKCSLEEKVSSKEKSCFGQSSQSRASDVILGTSRYSNTKGNRMLGGCAET
mmetsp:Transcript_101520/g.316570  ORF Transcript_101520/g.316570 Transcript_101520/m.316570 type:complete len:234 (+) Transcript_101520:243-944(+)